MNIAVITGASSGLGIKFLEAVLERYPDLDEYWIIARRKERLDSLAEKHTGNKIIAIDADLGSNASYDKSRKNGSPIKTVHFKFPVSYSGESVYDFSPPLATTDETCVLLVMEYSHDDETVPIKIDMDGITLKQAEGKPDENRHTETDIK